MRNYWLLTYTLLLIPGAILCLSNFMSQIICVFKVIGKDSGYKRKDIIVIIVMNESITHFCESLSQQHYSSAFVQHLVDTIAGNNRI